jgi:hypothetical protein
MKFSFNAALAPMILFILCALLLAAAFFLYPSRARAHDWFEKECCSGIDCRIAQPGEVTVRRDGVHVVTQGVNTVVPLSSPIVRPTLDPQNRPAICLQSFHPSSPPYMRCVYIPGGGT